MISTDNGCAEIAPKCARCRHPLVWRKGRLFQAIEPTPTDSVTESRPYFNDFRGGWICPDCDSRTLSEATAAQPAAAGR